jgi:hypothetical protein
MARTPIDLVPAATNWNLGTIGYLSSETLARFKRYYLPGDDGVVLKKTPGAYRNYCVLRYKLKTLSRERTGFPPDDVLEDEEEHIYDYDWHAPFVFGRTECFTFPYWGLNNPYTQILPLIFGENQYRGSDGTYDLAIWTLKAQGHKIPFRIYYTVVSDAAGGGDEREEDETFKDFNKGAGWEHKIEWVTDPGRYSWLINVRLAPLPA